MIVEQSNFEQFTPTQKIQLLENFSEAWLWLKKVLDTGKARGVESVNFKTIEKLMKILLLTLPLHFQLDSHSHDTRKKNEK
jgi:hypothetical protein